MIHYKVGFKSAAGYPVLYDQQYATAEEAKAAAFKHEESCRGRHSVWRITIEEVIV